MIGFTIVLKFPFARLKDSSLKAYSRYDLIKQIVRIALIAVNELNGSIIPGPNTKFPKLKSITIDIDIIGVTIKISV
jgi:hypothetical protein